MADHTIVLGGKEVNGTTKDLAIMLRKVPYEFTMTQIAKILDQTRSNISLVLKDTKYSGKKLQKRPLIDYRDFQTMRDSEIVRKYGVSLLSVTVQRKKLSIRQPKIINLEYRKRLLSEILFGKDYVPGSNFEKVIRVLVNNLPLKQNQCDLIFDFYFEGSLSTKNQKIYRHQVRQKIVDFVGKNMKEGDIEKMVKEGVLVRR